MRLQPLRDVTAAHPASSLDLRTWSVVARDGSALGTVAEVIVDVESRAPVYLQIEPHDPPEESAPACWICVPYREVDVDEDERLVVMSDLALLGLGTSTVDLVIGRAR
jgi:sporulation protein YlmC with PRC-barrel domain